MKQYKKQIFIGLGILGIIVTIFTGLSSFSHNTRDFSIPYIVIGILLSLIIIEIGNTFDLDGGKKDET